jgi:hypothetical protein
MDIGFQTTIEELLAAAETIDLLGQREVIEFAGRPWPPAMRVPVKRKIDVAVGVPTQKTVQDRRRPEILLCFAFGQPSRVGDYGKRLTHSMLPERSENGGFQGRITEGGNIVIAECDDDSGWPDRRSG